jgi:hypothetical protein
MIATLLKDRVLAAVASFLEDAHQSGVDGGGFEEIWYYLMAKKASLGFKEKQRIRREFLLSSLVLGADAAFCIDQQLVVRFKEQESEPRPRRRRNRKQRQA